LVSASIQKYPPPPPSQTVLRASESRPLKYSKGNELTEDVKADEYFKPVWEDIDNLLDPKLFIGRSVEIVEKYCGKGGSVEEKLAPYMDHITKSGTAQLTV
jgi:adenylosuccinate lyase